MVTGTLKAVPTLAVYEPALVMAGAWSTVRVKLWVTEAVPLVAVMMNVDVPATVGVPDRVAVPLAPVTKVTPAGRLPVALTAGAG